MALPVASIGNVNDPADGSFSCCCLAVSSLDRKRNGVVVHSVAKSVPVVLSDVAGSYFRRHRLLENTSLHCRRLEALILDLLE